MTNFRNLVIAPLNAAHDRAGFHWQDIRRRISRIFVATLPDNPKEVMGYYSLSTLSIELSQLPEKLARKLPKQPVPVALIGRLAVSKNALGCGIGKMLLVDAIKRTLTVSDQISPRLFLPLKSFEDNPVPINLLQSHA